MTIKMDLYKLQILLSLKETYPTATIFAPSKEIDELYILGYIDKKQAGKWSLTESGLKFIDRCLELPVYEKTRFSSSEEMMGAIAEKFGYEKENFKIVSGVHSLENENTENNIDRQFYFIGIKK